MQGARSIVWTYSISDLRGICSHLSVCFTFSDFEDMTFTRIHLDGCVAKSLGFETWGVGVGVVAQVFGRTAVHGLLPHGRASTFDLTHQRLTVRVNFPPYASTFSVLADGGGGGTWCVRTCALAPTPRHVPP